MTTPDRIARCLEYLTPAEVPEVLRALALFQRCGSMTTDEAEEWRVAVRARAADFLAPFAEA